MRKFSTLHVIDTLNVGGTERVFIDLINLLYEHEIPVTAMFILNGGFLQTELNPDIETIEIKRKKKVGLVSLLKAARTIRRFQITHCHSRHVYRYIRLIQRIFFINTKVILHDHCGSIKIDRSVPFLLGGTLKPEHYIGVSRELIEWASNELKITDDNIFLLENIIRKSLAEPIKNGEASEVVLVSNIKPNKNQSFVLDIIKELSVPLTLIGGIQDTDYFSHLQKKSAAIGNIKFLTDVFSIQPMLQAYKLGLHTSKSETGPLVLIEYLAQGLPFLAYETGEVAQILKPYFPQYFINNFDRERWIERILFLLQEKPNRTKMDEVFNKHFGSRQYVDKCLKIYANILN